MLSGWKTVILNVVMTAVMLIRLWQPDAELPDGAAVSGAVDALDMALVAVWGVAALIIRAVTSSPIFGGK